MGIANVLMTNPREMKHEKGSVTQNTGHTQNIGNVTPMFGSQCDCDHYNCDSDHYFGEPRL